MPGRQCNSCNDIFPEETNFTHRKTICDNCFQPYYKPSILTTKQRDLINQGKKLCTSCNTPHPLDMFTKNKNGLGGVGSKCKDCLSEEYFEKRDPTEKDLLFSSGRKRCTKCGIVKPLNMYGINKNNWSGHMARCKFCKKQDRDSNPNSKIRNAFDQIRRRSVRQEIDYEEFSEFYTRNNYCGYCNTDVSRNKSVDHIISVAKGGGNSLENLLVCCPSCNSSKRDSDLIDWVLDIDLFYENYLSQHNAPFKK